MARARRLPLLLCIVLVAVYARASQGPFRVPGSPYAAPRMGPNCARVIYTFDDLKLTQSQLLTIQTLQGILARSCPTLLRTGSGAPGDMQSVFAHDLVKYGVQLNSSLSGDFVGLLTVFRAHLQGYASFPFSSLHLAPSLSLPFPCLSPFSLFSLSGSFFLSFFLSLSLSLYI